MARWSTRRIMVIGLTGVTIVTGLAVTAGVADASTTPAHTAKKKPHATVQTHTTKTFPSKRAGVQTRSMAGTGRGSRVVSTLGKAGTPVTVSCYTVGQPVAHDRIWYRTTNPAGAYVPGGDLRSGHD